MAPGGWREPGRIFALCTVGGSSVLGGHPEFEARLPVLLLSGWLLWARLCLGKRLCSHKVFIKVA